MLKVSEDLNKLFSEQKQNDKPSAYKIGRSKGTGTLISQFASPAAQGILWAEVLGPCVSKRKGRGRYGL